MKRLSLIAFAAALSATGWAQTSAYQSADGNTSIFVGNAKASLIFNVSDASFDGGYLHEGAYKSLEYGFDFTGKPSSSLSGQIFQTGSTPPAFGASGSIGRHAIWSKRLKDQTDTTRLRDDWGLIRFTYTKSTFTTVESSSAEPVKQHFNGYRVMPSYNALLSLWGDNGIGLFLGAAAGVQGTNNASQMKQVTITTPVLQSATGIAPYQVVTQTTGYLGTYQTQGWAPVYSDAVLIPKKASWIDLDLFTRSNAAHAGRYVEGGIGVFLAEPKSPTKIQGGVSIAWKNGAPTYAIVGGFAF